MTIHFERGGAGEPLVLLHGLGGSARIWNPVFDRLAADRDVIALDLPGFGGSPELADGVRPTAANLAAAVSRLCGELGVARPHVAGNSLGAWIGLEMAKAGNTASVCCLSPAGLWRRPLGPRRFDSRRLGLRLRPLLPALLRSTRLRSALLGSTLAHPERLTRQEATGLVLDWLRSTGYDAANEEMRSSVFEHPELVTVPTTIAWGAEDRLISAPRPERMPPGTRYLVLEGCGHTATWDAPELIAELLLEASSEAAAIAP